MLENTANTLVGAPSKTRTNFRSYEVLQMHLQGWISCRRWLSSTICASTWRTNGLRCNRKNCLQQNSIDRRTVTSPSLWAYTRNKVGRIIMNLEQWSEVKINLVHGKKNYVFSHPLEAKTCLKCCAALTSVAKQVLKMAASLECVTMAPLMTLRNNNKSPSFEVVAERLSNISPTS